MHKKENGNQGHLKIRNKILFWGIICVFLLTMGMYSMAQQPPIPPKNTQIITGEAYYDGTIPADGANVTVINERTSEKLYDIVGPSGNSNESGWFYIDLSDMPAGRQNGDNITVIITGVGDYIYWRGSNSTTVDDTISHVVNIILTYDSNPPVTTKNIGEPKYGEYITSHTKINLTAVDDFPGVNKTYYRIWYNGSWTNFSEYSNNFTLSGEGLHFIEFYTTDKAGNVENVTNQTHYVDDTPPINNITIGGPQHTVETNLYINSSTPIWINASDIGVTPVGYYIIHWIIWNSTGIYEIGDSSNANVTLDIAENYMHIIGYWVEDVLGNRDPATGYHNTTVYIDNVPPTINITVGGPNIPIENIWYVKNNTEITINANDGEGVGLDTLRYRTWYEGSWSNWTYIQPQSNEKINLPEEGAYYLEIEAIDKLGNRKDIIENFYVDNTSPVTICALNPSSPNGENDWYVSSVTVTLTASDPDSSGVNFTKYRIDGGEWLDYTAPFIISSEGTHTLDYYSVDKVGNKETYKQSLFKIDKTAPSSSISLYGTKEGEVYTTAVTISISGSDSMSGIDYTEYRINKGSWTRYSGSFSLSEDGTYTIDYHSVDNAGNIEPVKTKTFDILKNQPPTAYFDYTPLHPTDLDIITFDASGSTDTDGTIANYTWNFGDGSLGYGKKPTHKYDDNGNYTVTLVIKDNKGATDTISKQIEVANNPPTAVFTYQPDKPKINEEVTFTDASSDDDGTIVNYTWNFGDGNISHEQNPSHKYTQRGKYTVTLTIRDNDGGIDTSSIDIEVTEEKVSYILPLISVIILIIIAIAVVLIWRSRIKT